MTTGLRLAGLEATAALGRRLAEALQPGDVVLLEGPLGAGKTELVRSIARGLGCPGEVVSPTFVLVRHYPGRLPLVHADLYRLETAAEVAALGLLEISEAGVLAVEWPERAPGLDDGGALRLRLAPSGDGEDRRTVELLSVPRHLAEALGAVP